MADLTEKVIDLLEDPTLEAVKVRQYHIFCETSSFYQ